MQLENIFPIELKSKLETLDESLRDYLPKAAFEAVMFNMIATIAHPIRVNTIIWDKNRLTDAK